MIRHDSIGQKQPEPCSLSAVFVLKNGSKTRSMFALGMPGPLSATEIYPLLPFHLDQGCLHQTVPAEPRILTASMALLIRLSKTVSSRSRSPATDGE